MSKIKRKESITLLKNLRKLKDLKGVKFSYAIARNIDILEGEVKAIEETLKPSDDFVEYEKERIEFAKKHSEKDKKGEPKIVKNKGREEFVIKDRKKFDKDFKKFKEKHKKALEEREKQIKEYLDFLETETDIKFYKVKLSNVPEDINVDQMQAIQQLIEE